jgi:hypothetical protein
VRAWCRVDRLRFRISQKLLEARVLVREQASVGPLAENAFGYIDLLDDCQDGWLQQQIRVTS